MMAGAALPLLPCLSGRLAATLGAARRRLHASTACCDTSSARAMRAAAELGRSPPPRVPDARMCTTQRDCSSSCARRVLHGRTRLKRLHVCVCACVAGIPRGKAIDLKAVKAAFRAKVWFGRSHTLRPS